MGNRVALTASDIGQANDMYQCVAGSQSPTPPPTIPIGGWLVESGPCTASDDGCISSGGFPANYANNMECKIKSFLPDDATIDLSLSFTTEGGYDFLTVAGHRLSGVKSTTVINVLAGVTGADLNTHQPQSVYWTADYSETKAGWKLCIKDYLPPGTTASPTAPTAFPTAAPTSSPTSPTSSPTSAARWSPRRRRSGNRWHRRRR